MANAIQRGGQKLERTISRELMQFMRSEAAPKLNRTSDEKTLEKIADSLWQLCLWEKQRADILDTKASYLLGLSSLAGAVVAIGSSGRPGEAAQLLVARGISLGLFVITVACAVLSLLVHKYGGFLDSDIFDSLVAFEQPVGDLPPCEDKDPYRCYLRETALQRWLVYRWYSDENDAKYRWVQATQFLAFLAVLSLFGYIVSVAALL